MTLPLRFVKEIHARLLVRYGSAWTSKWAGVQQEAIEADWADQLAGMAPEGIRKALAALPAEFPPTAPAFRALGVIRDESKPLPALPAPDPVGAKRAADSAAVATSTMDHPAQWMARLHRDVRAGNASRARIAHHDIATKNGYYGDAPAQVSA